MQPPSAKANNPPAPIQTAPMQAASTQAPSTVEIPDYNKIFTGYNPGRDYTFWEPEQQPPATASNRRSSTENSPFGSPTGTATQSGMVGGNPGRRRSIANFFSSVVGGDSHRVSSTSPTTAFSDPHAGQGSTMSPTAPPKDNLGRRRSSIFTFMGFKSEADENEHEGYVLMSFYNVYVCSKLTPFFSFSLVKKIKAVLTHT